MSYDLDNDDRDDPIINYDPEGGDYIIKNGVKVWL